MNKVFREHGVVSVFLAIILIPCIVVSSLFVDLSRILLSKGPATSAADLALNSLMSNYDSELAEIYGLFGSCQDIESYYAEAEEYFNKALKSKNLSDDEIESLWAMFVHVTSGDEISDLLSIESSGNGENGSVISAVPDTALNNPVIIEDQIVEFMKYRAPVEIVSGVMERLKKSGAAEAFGMAEENEELVEAKDEFAEDADDLSRQLYYTNERINDYKDAGLTNERLQQICDEMVKCRELYREINLKIVSNLYGTAELTPFTRYTKTITYYVNTYKLGSNNFKNTKYKLYSSKTDNGDGTTTYYINQEYMGNLIEDLKTKKDRFVTAKNNVISNVTKNLIDANVGYGADQTNPIQWWKQVTSKMSYSGFKTAADNMLIAYAKLLAAGSCEIDETYKLTWETTDKRAYEQIINDVKSLQGQYLVAGKVNSSDYYLKLVNKLEKYSSENKNNVKSGSLTLSNGKTIGATVSEISTKLNGYRTELEDILDSLDIILNGDGGDSLDMPWDKYKGLDNLDDYVEDYHSSFKNWQGVAQDGAGTPMADADLKEIDENKQKYSEVTKESVTLLENRFKNIKSQVKGVYDAINAMTYGGKKLVDIKDYSTVYNAVQGKIGTVPLKNSEIKTYAESIFKQLFVTYTSDSSKAVHTLANKNNGNYNPDLNVSKPSLYAYIEEEFKDAKDTTKEEREEKMDEIDSQDETNENADENEKDAGAGRVSESVKKKENNIYGGNYTASEFPSQLTGKNGFKLGESFFKSIGSIVKDLTSGNLTNSRDNIYLTEYCMNMFSYATYVNEGKRELYEKNNPDAQLTLTDYKNKVYTGEDITKLWNESSITATYNQSLTNHKINGSNNVAFGSEIEYVLYGKTNEKNIKSAYVDIFEIRYMLNLVSGFMYLWPQKKNLTADAINLTATGLSSATSGVVPAIFIKTVIIALLTVAETLRDLDVLEAGLSVPIFKIIEKDGDNDWYYTIKSGSLDLGDSKNDDAGKGKVGLYYSDYLYLFLMLGFGGGKKDAMLQRIGDVAQANMRLVNKKSDYSLIKSITYFQVDATIKVTPLMLDLSFADSYTNNPKNNEKVFSYKVKEIRGYS